MRTIIATYYNDFNYGALLQATALCRFISDKMDLDARLLDHSPPIDHQILRPWKSVGSIVRNLLTLPHLPSMRARARATRSFTDAYQRRTEPWRPGSPFPPADAWVAGSDQVWNVEHGISPLFFLRDIDPQTSRLVSYAASFGTERIPGERRSEVEALLRRFHAISVRETSGADIVESLLGMRPPVVCDPVFLLSPAEWMSMATPEERPGNKGGYILVYAIRKDETLERCTEFVKRKTGLPVIQLLPGFNLWALRSATRKRHDAGPGAFLSLVDNADFICTNSFHCGAFSLLLGKPFAMTPSTLGRSTRLTNLLETFGETNRYVESPGRVNGSLDFNALLAVDNRRRADCIEAIRASGMDFLKRSLS